MGCVALIAVFSHMDAALAGFALAFSTTVVNDLLYMVQQFVGLEQAMVYRQFYARDALSQNVPQGGCRTS